MTKSSARVNDPLSVWEHLLQKPSRQNGSLVMQLVSALIDAIDSKQIPEGVRLPSSRAIATSLRVGRNTVIAAINVLVEQRYLVARSRSGIFVAQNRDFESAPVREAVTSRRFDWVDRLDLRDAEVSEKGAGGAVAITHNFRYGQFDLSTFPTNHWRQC